MLGEHYIFIQKQINAKTEHTFTVDTVKWYVKSKQAICACLEIFSKYPFLTSNKICQLN